jgi:hypothetical protein
MTLHYPFRSFRVLRPLVSLQGRIARPRPIIPVTLLGPTSAVARDCLVDTGSDDTVFPESVAIAAGIDLSNAPVSSAAGVGLQALTLRLVEVTLRIADNQEQREWSAWVGFTSAKLHQPLLGFAGFLQFFDVLIRGEQEKVELTVNGAYPGT